MIRAESPLHPPSRLFFYFSQTQSYIFYNWMEAVNIHPEMHRWTENTYEPNYLEYQNSKLYEPKEISGFCVELRCFKQPFILKHLNRTWMHNILALLRHIIHYIPNCIIGIEGTVSSLCFCNCLAGFCVSQHCLSSPSSPAANKSDCEI